MVVTRASHRRRYAAMLKRLREAREAAGLTQAEVAAHFGRRQPWISKIENGERRIDPIELADLARLYGGQVEDFMAL